MPTTYSDLTSLLAGIASRIHTNPDRSITGDVHQMMDMDISRSLWAQADLKINAPGGSVAIGHYVLFGGVDGKTVTDGGAPVLPGIVSGTYATGDDARFGSIVTTTLWLSLTAGKTGVGVYDLNLVYGLNVNNGSMKLSQLYTLAVAQAKFAKVFQWYNGAGMSNATVMNFRHAPTCHNEAVLQGHGGGNWGTGVITSRNGVIWPEGVFHYNYSAIFSAGQYVGKGTAPSYSGSAGTVHVIDKAGWLEDTTFTPLWKDSFGSDEWTAYTYLEGTFIHNMRFAGLCNSKAHDPSYESAGISFRGPGEVAVLGFIKTDGFNGCGLRVQSGTPLYVNYISSFSNTLGAIGILGGALSTHHFGTISCDDNPCIFYVRDIDNQRSGGTVTVGLVKSETNARKVNNASGVPTYYRAQILVEADGLTGPNTNEGSMLNLVVDNYQYACQNGRTHALCAVRGFQDGLEVDDFSSPRKARVKIGSSLHWNSDYLMHSLGTKKAWANDYDYSMTGFTWNGSSGVLSRDLADGTAPSPVTVTGTRRLGFRTTEPDWTTVPAYDETFGGITTPDDALGAVILTCVSVLPSQITMAQTAQCYAQAIDQSYALRPDTGGFSVISGPATVNGAGVVTPTGVGIVKLRSSMSAWSQGFCYLNIVA